MPESFTDISKMPDRDASLAANHKLTIAGENWSSSLISARVTYTTDVGGSGLELEVMGSLEEYQDAPIRFSLGYGDRLVEYFVGRIYMPRDDDIQNKATATAFGPFRIMADQQLGTNETFVGRSLEWVIMELSRRAEHAPGEIVVINGRKYNVLPGESFAFDSQMSDVVNTICEKAEFVGIDQIGGRRVFMPRPRPGSNAQYKTTYTPGDYIAFSIDPKDEMSYFKVLVYRNGVGATPAVKAERRIDNTGRFQPPKNRWYVVSDFAGTQDEAKEECYRLAVNLREKEKSFSMDMFFNPDLHLYDGFRSVRTKFNNDDKQATKTYSCTIDDSISVDYSPGTPAIMTVSGSCYEIKRERIEVREAPRTIAVSSGVLTRDTVQDITFDDVSITMDDEAVRF